MAALSERFGTAEPTDTTDVVDASAATDAASASPDVADSSGAEQTSATTVGSPDLATEVAVFAARLREVLSSFQGAVDDLLADLESFLDAADAEADEGALAIAALGDEDEEREGAGS